MVVRWSGAVVVLVSAVVSVGGVGDLVVGGRFAGGLSVVGKFGAALRVGLLASVVV